MPPAHYLHATDDAVLLSVHVQPGAKRSALAGTHGDALKLRLAAPPVDGKANRELIRFLCALLQLPKSRVKIILGERSREKRIALYGADLSTVAARLTDPDQPSHSPP